MSIVDLILKIITTISGVLGLIWIIFHKQIKEFFRKPDTLRIDKWLGLKKAGRIGEQFIKWMTGKRDNED
jgi:hypothetical protein